MAEQNRNEKQTALILGGVYSAQAAHGVLAWRLSREVFARRRAAAKPIRKPTEQREECSCMTACMSTGK